MLQLHRKNCFIKKKNAATDADEVFPAGVACSPQCVMLSISGCCSTSSFSRSALGCSSLIHPVKSLLLSFSLPLFCPSQALAGSSSSAHPKRKEHLYGLKNHRVVAKNVGEFCWIYCRSHMKTEFAYPWFWRRPWLSVAKSRMKKMKKTFSCLTVGTFVALQQTDTRA